MPRRGKTAVVRIDAYGRRPKSTHGPGHHGQQHRPRTPQKEFRPFRRWLPFLVPLFVAANVGLFMLTMYVNDCPAHAAAADAAIGEAAVQAQGCLLQQKLGRFAFQPYRKNPLIGPSSTTFDDINGEHVKVEVMPVKVFVRSSISWMGDFFMLTKQWCDAPGVLSANRMRAFGSCTKGNDLMVELLHDIQKPIGSNYQLV